MSFKSMINSTSVKNYRANLYSVNLQDYIKFATLDFPTNRWKLSLKNRFEFVSEKVFRVFHC